MSKSEKVVISLRAAVARYNRQLAKSDEKLITFRTPLDSVYTYGIVDTGSNVLTSKGDFNDLEAWMREAGTLKPYEVIGE
jgi:hypothetical protein